MFEKSIRSIKKKHILILLRMMYFVAGSYRPANNNTGNIIIAYMVNKM